MFSDPVIMTVMSKHLTLRDIGDLAQVCKWDQRWRSTMSSVLHLYERALLRWPKAPPARQEDMFEALRQRARDALCLVVDDEAPFTCWISQCEDDHRSTLLMDQRCMPYSTCRSCFYWSRGWYESRHVLFVSIAESYCIFTMIRLIGDDTTEYARFRNFLKEFRLGFILTKKYMRQCGVRTILPNGCHSEFSSTKDMDAMVANFMSAYDVRAKWERYKNGERASRQKKRRVINDDDDDDDPEWVE